MSRAQHLAVQAWQRLRENGWHVVEASAAATIAWFLAADVLGHPQPFFAPAAALIVLGQARGERIGRTVEILLGVAGGVLAADLVVGVLGARTTAAIVVVVFLVTVVTVALGAGGLLSVQAAISGLYVAVIAPPTDSLVPVRFIDALIGGVVALVASQLSRPRDPVAALVVRALAVLDETATVLAESASAIETNDLPAARAVLDRARAADAGVEQLRAQVAATRETLWVDLRRRERLAAVDAIDAASEQIDYLVRNVRVLARLTVTIATRAAGGDGALAEAVRLMGRAVLTTAAGVTVTLRAPYDVVGDPQRVAEDAVLAAVRAGGALLGANPAFPTVLGVGQLRACAIDLLRVAGQDRDDSVIRVEEALGLPLSE